MSETRVLLRDKRICKDLDDNKRFFLNDGFKVTFVEKKISKIHVCLCTHIHSQKAQTLSIICWRHINVMVDLSF